MNSLTSKRAFQAVVGSLALMALPGALRAQTPDTATLRGQITDPAHTAVSGVRVTALNTLTGLDATPKQLGCVRR